MVYNFSFAQEKYTISGYIQEEKTAERLISATIFEINKNKGATSNTYGFYSLTLAKGEVSLYASYVGYQTSSLQFNLKKDTIINFNLNPSLSLDEVVIVAKKSTKN